MPGLFKVEKKDGFVYKFLKKNSDIGKIIHYSLKSSGNHKKNLQFYNYQVLNGYKKPYIGKHIVKGFLFTSGIGNYYSHYIDGLQISDIVPENLSVIQKILYLYSLQELIINLTNYKKKNNLIGDWALHNLIYNEKNGYIINIDLEGLYTYSSYGPELPWEKKENKLSYVRKELKGVMKRICQKISFIRDNTADNSYLSLIYLPTSTKINWLFPSFLTKTKENISNNIFYLELGDLEGYKTEIFIVYFYLLNQEKLTCIIVSEKQVKPRNSHFFFRFKACVEKGYEHPIGIKLENNIRPQRTDISFSENEGDFYIKKFYN